MAPNPARAPWVVSVQPHGRPLPEGGGTLISERLVLTCAHVVDPGTPAEPPEGPVLVRFPFLPAHEPVPARVLPGGWHPPKEWAGDVAVLELDAPAPPGAEPAPLRRTDADVFGHTFRAHGFPAEHKTGGVPIRGEIVGYAEGDWLQLESTAQTGWATEPGFSGAPVWNNTLHAVIGVLGRRQKPGRADRRVGFALSLDPIARLWPPLAALVHDITEQERRERLARLLAVPLAPSGELPRLDQVDPHDLGVSESTYTAGGYEPYVDRPVADRGLDTALAAGGFVLVVGRSKAGKSRTLHERLSAAHGAARLVVPRRGRRDLAELARAGLPHSPGQVVVWLDDLHHYLLSGAIDAHVLDLLLQHDPPCLVVGTLTHRHREELAGLENEVGRATREVLRRATVVHLPHTLTDEEREAAADLYPQEDFSLRGLGEMLVAAPALETRLEAGLESCPEGRLLVRAAADWARVGSPVLLDEPTLRELFDRYRLRFVELDLDPGDEPYRTALAWARDRAQAGIALLVRARDDAGRPGYEVFPYVAEYLDSAVDAEAVDDAAWELAAQLLDGADLLTLGMVAVVHDRADIAEEQLRRVVAEDADDDLTAAAALFLSTVLIYRREFAEAELLLQRAADSGLEDVAELAQSELGGLLSARGEHEAARTLLERAVRSQDPDISLIAQVALAGVLWQLDETEQAERLLTAVLAHGVEEMPPQATARLGRVLSGRGTAAVLAEAPGIGPPDHAKRVPALRSAPSSAEPPADQPWSLSRAVGSSVGSSISGMARASLGGLLVGRGELDRAEELLRSVLADGNPEARPIAQSALGELLIVRGRYAESAELLELALANGGPWVEVGARLCLGVARLFLGDTEEGVAHLRQVVDLDQADRSPEAMSVLGHFHLGEDDYPEAEQWLRRAIATGHRDWALMGRTGLACLLYGRDQDDAGACALLAEVAASGHRDEAARAADLLGDVHEAQGRPDEAAAAYRRAIAFGHHTWSWQARIDLALLIVGEVQDPHSAGGSDAVEEATALLTATARSPHPHLGPHATYLLGGLLDALERPEEAVDAYRLAVATEHPAWSPAARIDLATLLVDLDRPEEAEALLRELMASGHTVAAGTGVALLGVLLVLTPGREAEGLTHLRTAVDTADGPALQLARFHLATRLLDTEEAAHAEELLRAVLADEPSDVTEVARARLAALLLDRDDTQGVADLLATEDDPVPAYVAAGGDLLEVGELDAAVRLMEAARELPASPDTPRATTLLGIALRARNDFPRARDVLTEALATTEPDLHHLVRRYLGSTLFRLREFARAEEVLRPVAEDEQSPHHPEAVLLLALVVDSVPDRERDAATWFEAAIRAADPDVAGRARVHYTSLLQRLGDETRAREVLAMSSEDPTPTPRTPLPAASPPPEPDGLPAAVLLLLAELADAEDEPVEATYWRTRAAAADR
ncbi:tetratricopeptide repeat protein [Kitasatospora sp. NPDC048722]|uniref:tetratricopeptide repeat protein n=1 Tax=Kitasatospora sp. NPDC048722 TaxID=3155639 RepID=UPI0033D10841